MKRFWLTISLSVLGLVGHVSVMAAQARSLPPGIALEMNAPDVLTGETPVVVSFSLTQPAHVLIVRIDTDGRASFVYPAVPDTDSLVPAGGPHRVLASPHSHAAVSFVVDEYPGVGYLFAIASRTPFALESFTVRDRWNRHALFPDGRVRGDPYAAFADLVERLIPDSTVAWGYDGLPYTVGERYQVPRFTCYGCHTDPGYPWRGDYREWCATFRVDLVSDLAERFKLLGMGGRVWGRPVIPTAIFVYTPRLEAGEPPVRTPAPRAGETSNRSGILGRIIGELVGSRASGPDATNVGDPKKPLPRLERRKAAANRGTSAPSEGRTGHAPRRPTSLRSLAREGTPHAMLHPRRGSTRTGMMQRDDPAARGVRPQLQRRP